MEIRYTLSRELLVALSKCTLGKQEDLFPELQESFPWLKLVSRKFRQ
jgi:hypothetical protein